MKRLPLALLSLLLSLLLVVLLALGWLTLTTGGARWAADWLRDYEPRLDFQVQGGALGYGLQLGAVRWQSETLRFAADQLTLEWTPSCLLGGRLCIELVRVEAPRVVVSPAPEPVASPADAAGEPFKLPLGIQLSLLQLSDVEVELPDYLIRLEAVQASASMSQRELAIGWARLRGLEVEQRGVGEAPAPTTVGDAGWGPIELPAVDLPFAVTVDGLLLERASLQLGGAPVWIDSLALSAGLRNGELRLRKLQLEVENLRAEASGEILLREDYPLSLRLSARALPEGLAEPIQLDVQLGGSLARLSVEAEAEGALRATLAGRLQPLQPRLPFELQARWPRLGWPLQAPAVAVLSDGELRAQGDLQGYQMNLDSRVDGEQIPPGRWRLQARGDLEGLVVESLQGQVLDGELSAEGRLSWAQGLSWQAALRASGINPGAQWPDYPGRLGGRLRAEGRVTEEGWTLSARPDIDGRLRDYPVALGGTVAKTAAGAWRFQGLRLASGANRLELDGRLQERWDLAGRFQLPEPQALLPELRGSASGGFSLAGPLEQPDVRLRFEGRELVYNELRAAELAVEARLGRLGYADSTLLLTASGLAAGESKVGRLRAELEGRRDRHLLTLSLNGEPYAGELVLAGGLTESLDWRGELRSAELGLPPEQRWTLESPVDLAWRQGAARLTLQPHCWRQQQASLCLSEPARIGERGELALALEDFQLQWLGPWLPEGVVWQGPLQAGAALAWRPGVLPTLELSAVSRDGEVDVVEEDDVPPVRLDYQRLAVGLSVQDGRLLGTLDLESRTLGNGRLRVATRPEAQPRPLQGEVELDGVRLEILKPFLPQMQALAGELGLSGALGGTLQAPEFNGQLRLREGRLATPGMPMELREVALTAEIQGSQARLSGSFASGGGGEARLEGEARWGGEEWALRLGLEGERLLLTYEPLARLRVSPDLDIRVRPKRVAVSGRVVVPSGEISLQQLPEGAVAVSEDVVVVRRPGEEGGVVTPEPPPPAPGWSITTDVELILGDEVQLTGMGLEGRLAGNLRLRQRPGGVPEAVGELRIVDGRYEAYGQELEIRRGQLLFSGPVREPNLNVEAVRRVEDVVAGIRVEGSPDAPEVSLFSNPTMPQEDVLSYIIRGRPLDEAGSTGQDALLSQAALSLGIFGGRGLATSLAEELGIEDFELGTTGEGEETQVELSGYLAPNLHVRYGMGVFQPLETLTLRYQISRRFYVEAVRGLESAVDVFYQFEF